MIVNIGQCIKDELTRQERTVSWLANKLNCTRSGVYRIFEKNSIDTAMLFKISVILKHNFFETLTESINRELMNEK